MPVDLAPSVKLKPVFPAAAIEACLREELIEAIKIRVPLEGRTFPNNSAAMLTAPFALDSLEVVELLCTLDELLGFELPEDIVRVGGYETIGEAIGHLMPGIEKKWRKRNGGGT